jgi:hypothetical protein
MLVLAAREKPLFLGNPRPFDQPDRGRPAK